MDSTDKLINKIWKTIEGGDNLMIVGQAGTGKSYFIRRLAVHLESKGKTVVKTAATGVAAVNIGGSTLHSWCGVGIAQDSAVSLAEDIKAFPAYKKRWLSVDILIIDEISMIGAYLFDKLNEVAKIVRYNKKVWGGIQMILVGDLLQLPPVKDKWIFRSRSFEKLMRKGVVVSLTKPKRYPDKDWYQLLSRIRVGKPNSEDITKLNKRMEAYDKNWLKFREEQKEYKIILAKNPNADIDWTIMPTILYSKKRDVAQENYEQLKSLPTEERRYVARDEVLKGVGSTENYKKVLEDIFPAVVDLKIGAQVMLTYNMWTEKGLCNGSRGVITKYIGEGVEVKFLHSTEVIQRKSRTNKTTDGNILLRSQIPLIVAYSTTIHKSQGASLDYIVVDIGRDIFLPGQAYVALSRCRTLEGTFICAFSKDSITKVVNKALNFLIELGVE